MQQNFSTTKFPTAASQTTHTGGATWLNPNNILLDDGSTSNLGLAGSGAATLYGKSFGMSLPHGAIVDGVEVFIDCTLQNGGWVDISLDLGLAATTVKPITTVNGTHGSPTDLWGASSIDPSDLANLEIALFALGTVDDNIRVDYLTVTVYWHIDLNDGEGDVPTRVAYKVFSRDGNFLGELPNVTSKLNFAQDINSAGSSIVVTCGKFVKNEVTVSPLLTESGDVITTESDLPILATSTDLLVTTGSSPDEAIFKNSNRVVAFLYNKYYPNGKPIFSGQINRVNFKYGGGDASVKLTIYSDGIDLNNFIARGYPFIYTNDQVNNLWNTLVDSYVSSFGGWNKYGQTFTVGGGVTNIGAISVGLVGTAQVTLKLYSSGALLASATRDVAAGGPNTIQFAFPSLVPVTPGAEYFFEIVPAAGQSIQVCYQNSDVYLAGAAAQSLYSGGSGGGGWSPLPGDLYFQTAYGTPTTTTTYTSDDPVTEMARGILLDYNARGGLIKERDFEAAGILLTYTFVVAFVYDAIKKILELCPTGFYAYVDLGTAEIDIKQMSTTPDFTVVKGRHINELDLSLSIEQVQNYMLFSGGDTGGGSNLYRDYADTESTSNYGIRTVPKSDNRVTSATTADAIGETFIEENAQETQETSLTVLNDHIDITLLTPGKTIGFKNFGNFIDEMVVQIVRREPNFSDGVVKLTLGRLPVRMNDEIQNINRGLLNEQTIKNPSAPS